jgi:hypothetical protein
MYFHMVGQRASAFAARNRPTPKPNGIEFPVTDKVSGERGTTEMNKGCFAAAVDGVDNAEKKRIMDEKNWRFKYVGCFVFFVCLFVCLFVFFCVFFFCVCVGFGFGFGFGFWFRFRFSLRILLTPRYNKYVLSHAQIMASKDALTVVKMARQGTLGADCFLSFHSMLCLLE